MKVLKVKNYEITDFEDGGLSRESELPKYLNEKIEAYKPTYILTFEPNGLYGHTDHVFLSQLLTELAHTKNIKIIYTTIPNTYRLDKGALNMSILNPLPNHLEANFILKLSLLELLNKIKAFYMYRSQFSFKKELLFRPFNFLEIRKEYYTLKDDN